jgi:hypothetical protein
MTVRGMRNFWSDKYALYLTVVVVQLHAYVKLTALYTKRETFTT